MLSSKQPSDGINSLNTQGLRPEKDQEIFFEAQRLQWAGCLECLAGVHYEAMRIFGLQIETTVGTGGGLRGPALAPRMTRLTARRSRGSLHAMPSQAPSSATSLCHSEPANKWSNLGHHGVPRPGSVYYMLRKIQRLLQK